MTLDRLFQWVTDRSLPTWIPEWSLGFAVPVAALLVYAVVSRVVPYLFPVSRRNGARVVFRRTRLPMQALLFTLLTQRTLQETAVSEAVSSTLNSVIPFVLVIAGALLASRFSGSLFVFLRSRFETTTDDLKARRATTQIVILERVVEFTIAVIAISIGLIVIPGVRAWGTSILASAGVLGLIFGFAAQQTIANVLGGIQIAISQPLRIDDTVVIDGEWGTIEEITLTYVVVRIWDKRRLVVPISHLLQRPFQNWSRNSTSIIGTVFLYADYTVDVDALRVEQTRTLAASELWDGEVDVIQVTNTSDRTVELRSLVSAANAGDAWTLRCELRERLVTFLSETQPNALPRERMRIHGTVTANAKENE